MSELSVKVTADHVLDSSLVKCSCGELFEIAVLADERQEHTAHLLDVTEAAVRETIAADIEAKATQFRATSDEMQRVVIAREPHDFDADAIIRYAAYAFAWESAARIAKGES